MPRRYIALVSAAVFLAAGCGRKGPGKPRVGFILKTFQEERYKKDRAEFEKAVKEMGGEVLFDSCNNDEPTQISKVETMLTRGIDALVLQPVNSNTAGSLVEKAHEKGVRVISYDTIIKNIDLDYFVTQDSLAVGYLQAEEALKKAKKGKWVLLMGQPGDSNARTFSEGVIKTAIHNHVEIALKRSHEGWAPEKAQMTTEDAITQYGSEITAIIANNSGMAWGALQALEAHKLAGKVFLAGSDADLRNIKAVANGKQHVEIFKAIKPLAVAAAKVAMNFAKGNQVGKEEILSYQDELMKQFGKRFKLTSYDNGKVEVPAIVTPVYLVTQKNIEDTVVKSGFHTKGDIFTDQ